MREPIEHGPQLGPPKNLASGLVKALRPRQWVKNVLVLAAPMAAGTDVLTDGATMLRVLVAFVAFCLIASATYLINDALDVRADRNHPTKRFRPIAAGVVPQNLAFGLAAVLAVAAIGVSFLANWQTAVTIAVYFAIQLGYCFGLKHQAVIDICIVSSGFLIRAIAGGVAAQLPGPVALVPAGHGVRFAVHGGRQTLRRTGVRRAHRRQDPQVAAVLHRHLPAVRVDAVGDGGGAVLRSPGPWTPLLRWTQASRWTPQQSAATTTTSSTRSRSSRSPSRSCGTRSASTAVKRANPRRSPWATASCSSLAVAWIACVGVAVYAF